jgi:hypothetical protein
MQVIAVQSIVSGFLQGESISNAIDNWPILSSAWAFQVIPLNQNSYEIDQMGRFLLNN